MFIILFIATFTAIGVDSDWRFQANGVKLYDDSKCKTVEECKEKIKNEDQHEIR